MAHHIKDAFVPLAKELQGNVDGGCLILTSAQGDSRITRGSDFTLVLQLLSVEYEDRAELVVSSLVSFLLELPDIRLEYAKYQISGFTLVNRGARRS